MPFYAMFSKSVTKGRYVSQTLRENEKATVGTQRRTAGKREREKDREKHKGSKREKERETASEGGDIRDKK